jgi:UDP-N-acetylmuramoyl-L-alanyl-D-glutamate--2,6-diaminopimelate ligase
LRGLRHLWRLAGIALSLARQGDVVLLAGKGHEQSIIYGTEPRPWDEREVARQALHAAGYGSTHAPD